MAALGRGALRQRSRHPARDQHPDHPTGPPVVEAGAARGGSGCGISTTPADLLVMQGRAGAVDGVEGFNSSAEGVGEEHEAPGSDHPDGPEVLHVAGDEAGGNPDQAADHAGEKPASPSGRRRLAGSGQRLACPAEHGASWGASLRAGRSLAGGARSASITAAYAASVRSWNSSRLRRPAIRCSPSRPARCSRSASDARMAGSVAMGCERYACRARPLGVSLDSDRHFFCTADERSARLRELS